MVVKKQFRQSHFEVPYFVFNHHTVLLAKNARVRIFLRVFTLSFLKVCLI